MKTPITTLMALIAGGGILVAADIFPPLTTTDGQRYDHITAQRTDPDGLYIEYTLPGNGMGVAKVKFSRLPARLRKQCGYSEADARDYEDAADDALLAYQAWVDERQAARQQAEAEAYAYQVEQAAMTARQAPPPEGMATTSGCMIYGAGGWSSGGQNLLNSRTVTTFQGPDPQDRLIGPSTFSKNIGAASARPR